MARVWLSCLDLPLKDVKDGCCGSCHTDDEFGYDSMTEYEFEHEGVTWIARGCCGRREPTPEEWLEIVKKGPRARPDAN